MEPKPDWEALADQIEKQVEAEQNLDRDEHDIEVAFERLVKAGRYAAVQRICEEFMASIPKEIT